MVCVYNASDAEYSTYSLKVARPYSNNMKFQILIDGQLIKIRPRIVVRQSGTLSLMAQLSRICSGTRIECLPVSSQAFMKGSLGIPAERLGIYQLSNVKKKC